MSIKTVVVPDLGGAESVDVIELSLAIGDSVELEGSLLVLESDKATMDVPSPFDGQLVKYLVSEGDTVRVGDAIAELETMSNVSDAPEQAEVSPVDAVSVTVPIEPPVEISQSNSSKNRSEVENKPELDMIVDHEVVEQNELDQSDVYAGPALTRRNR